VKFASRPAPMNDLEAKVSLHHWVAVALAKGKPGVAEGTLAMVRDAKVASLRARIEVVEDHSLSNQQAWVEVETDTGQQFSASVSNCIGSLDRPMTDRELEQKFIDQTEPILGIDRTEKLLRACRDILTVETASSIAELARC
jgi:2-methylcitrate dehydratase PrpD